MRRVLLPAALFLLVFAAFAGCGQKQDAEVVLDIEECAAQLLAEVDFADELTKIDGEMVQALYLLGEGDAESFAVYVSSGATAEEIAVFAAVDLQAAKRIEEAVLRRIAEQKASFADYLPAEMPKLNDPFLKKSGRYIILCISGHNGQAERVADRLLAEGRD